jgi:hypothetical protein
MGDIEVAVLGTGVRTGGMGVASWGQVVIDIESISFLR